MRSQILITEERNLKSHYSRNLTDMALSRSYAQTRTSQPTFFYRLAER